MKIPVRGRLRDLRDPPRESIPTWALEALAFLLLMALFVALICFGGSQ